MTILPTLIQSVAHPPRDVTQPGSGRTTDAVSVQAAPFPHPCVNSLQRAATGVDGSVPSALSFDEDGPRIVWAPLAIIIISAALWTPVGVLIWHWVFG